jgi:hypothetical protein
MAVPVGMSESGMLQQRISLELDPIPGRMITPIWAEMVSVFVPVQAIDAIRDPAAAYAGMDDVIRQKLLTMAPLFDLENEGEISKRCNVEPVQVAGVKRVNSMVRLAHNCAVNYLRRRLYDKATQLLHGNSAVTPALLSSTVLQRMNAVLDPDDRINGAIDLALPNVNLPITNLFVSDGSWSNNGMQGVNADGSLTTSAATNNRKVGLKQDGATANVLEPQAIFSGVTAGNLSLTDFYNAEKQDQLVRIMRQLVEDNPEYGEEMVLRWAHGLSVETGKTPFVLAQRRVQVNRALMMATDTAGITNETMRSDLATMIDASVMIPKTELGGVVITFLQVTPDETLARQPHPILAQPWGLINHVAEELLLDPVAVTMRELDSAVAQASETTVAFYVGHNELKRAYVAYGLSRQLDPATIENKTAVWTYEIPLSVTPNNILYPDVVDQSPPFAFDSEVVTYTISSSYAFATPLQYGPTPVETLAIIDTADLFDEV